MIYIPLNVLHYAFDSIGFEFQDFVFHLFYKSRVNINKDNYLLMSFQLNFLNPRVENEAKIEITLSMLDTDEEKLERIKQLIEDL